MQTSYSKFVSWMGALALALVIVPGAAAQCGLSIESIKAIGLAARVWGVVPGDGSGRLARRSGGFYCRYVARDLHCSDDE
jgi:hypothetical protein